MRQPQSSSFKFLRHNKTFCWCSSKAKKNATATKFGTKVFYKMFVWLSSKEFYFTFSHSKKIPPARERYLSKTVSHLHRGQELGHNAPRELVAGSFLFWSNRTILGLGISYLACSMASHCIQGRNIVAIKSHCFRYLVTVLFVFFTFFPLIMTKAKKVDSTVRRRMNRKMGTPTA